MIEFVEICDHLIGGLLGIEVISGLTCFGLLFFTLLVCTLWNVFTNRR